MTDLVRIGCWAAFWGDTPHAAAQVLEVPDLDYLVGDHLAEITMALLARARAKDPDAGFVPDAVTALSEILPTVAERAIGDYFERTSHPYHLTSALRDDGLIDPVDTRNMLGMALSASLSAPIERTPNGVLRI